MQTLVCDHGSQWPALLINLAAFTIEETKGRNNHHSPLAYFTGFGPPTGIQVSLCSLPSQTLPEPRNYIDSWCKPLWLPEYKITARISETGHYHRVCAQGWPLQLCICMEPTARLHCYEHAWGEDSEPWEIVPTVRASAAAYGPRSNPIFLLHACTVLTCS